MRQQVRRRAGNRCEYCFPSEEDAFFAHEVDHVIAEKHGGVTTPDNWALACFDCNRFKGSDIASLDPGSGSLVASQVEPADMSCDTTYPGRLRPLSTLTNSQYSPDL